MSAISGDIPSLGGEHIAADGGFNFTNMKRVPRSFFEKMGGGGIARGDILIVKDGATTGKTSFVGDDFPFEEAAVNEHVFCVRVDERLAVPAYIFHFLFSYQGQKSILLDFRGATVGGISRSFASKTLVPLPSKSEQRRIADILDRADALRAKRRAAIKQLDTLRQSIFLDMFGDPASNSKQWPMRTVGELADVQGGLQLSASRRSLPLEMPYLRVANVYRGRLNLVEVKTMNATHAEVQRTLLADQDILVVEGHGNANEIGRCALWDASISPCVHQNHLIRARVDHTTVVARFMCDYLNSVGGRRHLIRSGKSTSGLNTINVSQVRSTPVAVPPLTEQLTYVDRMASVESLEQRGLQALACLDSLLASIQHRAFRGEL